MSEVALAVVTLDRAAVCAVRGCGAPVAVGEAVGRMLVDLDGHHRGSVVLRLCRDCVSSFAHAVGVETQAQERQRAVVAAGEVA